MGLLRQEKGYYAKYKSAFSEHNTFDVLFLGSSRAEMAYDTGLFDSLMKSNSFNLSMAGATPQVAFAALKTYLEKSKAPKTLYYEIDYHALKKRSKEIKEFNNYFPFLTNPTLRREFTKIDGRMLHFYYNPYYSWPYTGWKNLSSGFHGWFNIPNQSDNDYYKGFIKEVRRPPLDYLPGKDFYSFFNLHERNYLDSIIQLCSNNHIRITLVSSAIFGGGNIGLLNKKQITNQIRNIAKIHGIVYLDLSSLPFCNNRSLFIDHYHLNYRGALMYTRYFARVINNKGLNSALN